MLGVTSVSGSDDWWLMRAASALGEGLPRLYKLQAYQEGTNTIPAASAPIMRDGYARLVNMSRLNFARNITSAVVTRRRAVGFRTAVASDADGDEAAMRVWRESRMVRQSKRLTEDVAVFGSGFTVTAGDGIIERVSVMNAMVDAPENRPWDPDAAVVFVRDEIEQHDVLVLFRRDDSGRVYSRRAARQARVSSMPTNGSRWVPGRGWGWIEDPQLIPWASRIPVVEHSSPSGKGEFEPHIDTLDRVNHGIFNRLCIQVMQAFRQRAVKGDLPQVYPAGHPQAGQRVNYDEIFEAGPAALWMLPAGADIWESAIADITPLLTGTEKDLKHVSAASSTPLYLLSPDAQAGAAEGAALAREALVFKVDDGNDHLSYSYAESLGLSFAARGDSARADASQIEVIWSDPNRASLAERGSAASQAVTSLPRKTIWRTIWGMTPSEIEQAEQDAEDEAFSGAVSGLGVTGNSEPGSVEVQREPAGAAS